MKVTAENLGKRFNREWVFRNLNYEFTAGNCYAITGPNGSGKSTLMQVLWGQMQPSAGLVNYSTSNPSEIFKSVAIATPFMDEPCTNLDKKSVEWYHTQLAQVSPKTSVFIASNQEIEYPSTALKIDILSHK